jgi:cytoskeletal protein RodZ
LLAAVRTRMGLSVQDVADHTRISLKYLEALEGEVRTQLPSSTFVRGYVREVARLYLLEVDAVVAGYMRRFDG